jgi:hypothetical protein
LFWTLEFYQVTSKINIENDATATQLWRASKLFSGSQWLGLQAAKHKDADTTTDLGKEVHIFVYWLVLSSPSQCLSRLGITPF